MRARAAAGVAAVAVLGAAVVHAALPQQSGNIDLLAQANVRIDGALAGDVSGEAVGSAGDVNGDGRGDVIVGAGDGSAAWVVFGRPDPVTLDLASLGANGFKISGAAELGRTVAGIGDMNGDGRSEVAVAAPGAAKAFVIFGKADQSPVDVAALGSQGFEISNVDAAVGRAGDVNGDGAIDVIVGDKSTDAPGRNGSGSAVVVFGKTSSATVDAAALGAAGYRILGAVANQGAGAQVAGGQDVNGDGTPDQVISADNANFNGNGSGSVYVALGKGSTTDLDLADPASGFRIDGENGSDGLGRSVGIAGDMNGDGLSEVVAGASFADNPSGADTSSGSAYVVFGKASASAVDLGTTGWGFRIDGEKAGDQAARSVSGGQDVNGDGLPDVVVGALNADSSGRTDNGAAYVVFGKATQETVSLGSLGSGGYRMEGPEDGDFLGRGVAMMHDFNGDGRPDVVAGAEFAAANGRATSGSTFVTYGFGPASLAYPNTTHTFPAGVAITPLAPSEVARTGTPAFTVDPALPAGLSLDAATGTISGTPTAAQPAALYTVTMTDLTGSATTVLSIAITAQQAAPPPGGSTTPTLLPGRCANVRRGTRGADTLTGTALGDRLIGGAGNDLLSGLAGHDCLAGEAGHDRLRGGTGNDRLTGGAGRDRVDGGAGRDRVDGGAGNDRLTGGTGRDVLLGGAGNDLIKARDGARDTIRCGRGRDRVTADRGDRTAGCEKVSRR